jgi:hypothetical protein
MEISQLNFIEKGICIGDLLSDVALFDKIWNYDENFKLILNCKNI